ncbi:MAG: MarR family winged helix-turn-helix transcriptional regulator [Bacillota bacterium]
MQNRNDRKEDKRDDVLFIMDLFERSKPEKAFQEVHRQKQGILAVMAFLYHQAQPVSSKEISQHMAVSSARMTVILQKLEQKGCIEKKKSKKDTRGIDVVLTEKGLEIITKMEEKKRASFERIVEKIGFEQLKEMFQNLETIKKILEENLEDFTL